MPNKPDPFAARDFMITARYLNKTMLVKRNVQLREIDSYPQSRQVDKNGESFTYHTALDQYLFPGFVRACEGSFVGVKQEGQK